MRESAFYAHFKSKREAFDELLREAGPGVIVALAGAVDETQPPEIGLTKLAESAMGAWTSAAGRGSINLLAHEVFAESGPGRRRMVQGISLALDVLQTEVRELAATGSDSGRVGRKDSGL